MISKEFQAHYDRLCYSRSRENVFCDFLDVSLYCLSAGMLSEDYLRVEKQYTKEEMPLFFEMLHIIADASEDFEDALGGVFMQFISNGHNGQFFTDNHIGRMMAFAVRCDELTPEQSVCDPTCGSGTLLLAAAKTCVDKNQGRRPRCFGSDIDIICVKMAVVNMLMNSIPGEIAWMNALTMEHWRSYCIQHTETDFRVILSDLQLSKGHVYTLNQSGRILALAIAYPEIGRASCRERV